MEIEFTVVDGHLGVRNAEKFEIEDNDQTFEEWQRLHATFMREFGRFASPEEADYAFPEWHHGLRQLGVYLYSERFYDGEFIAKIKSILANNPGSFAQFECYTNDQDLLGTFQVYPDKVCFDLSCEESGLIPLLIPGVSVAGDP